jgi:hypothetical protein
MTKGRKLAVGLGLAGDWGNPAVKHGFIEPPICQTQPLTLCDADHVQRVTLARQTALFERRDSEHNGHSSGFHLSDPIHSHVRRFK